MISFKITRRNRKKVKVCNGYDYFQNLSDDLLLLIFSKLIGFDQNCRVRNIKFLCQCSLVSKRFNSIIPLLSSLRIVSKSRARFPQILNKFQHIRSLYIETGYSSLTQNIYINWKATCGPSTSYCIAAISYDSIEKYCSTIHKNIPSFILVNQEEYVSDTDAKRIISIDCKVFFRNILHDSILRGIKNHKKLEHVVLTDREKQGSMILNKEQLVDLRNTSINTCLGLRHIRGLKHYFIEILHLPVSGVLLKRVNFGIMKVGKNAFNHSEVYYDHILRGMNFQDDETIFHEALVSLFGKLRTQESKV